MMGMVVLLSVATHEVPDRETCERDLPRGRSRENKALPRSSSIGVLGGKSSFATSHLAPPDTMAEWQTRSICNRKGLCNNVLRIEGSLRRGFNERGKLAPEAVRSMPGRIEPRQDFR